MTIEVEVPGGEIIEFPDDTPPDTIKSAVQKLVASKASPPAPAEQPRNDRDVSFIGGITDAALQGATFGFSDEINAGMRSGLRGVANLWSGQDPEFGTNYDRALADERARLKEFEEQGPWQSAAATAANVAGSLTGSGPAAAAGGLIRQGARMIGTGAASGALGGFGAAEGGLENRLEGAGWGGAAGAALGAAIPAAGAVAGQGIRTIRNVAGMNKPHDAALDILNQGLARDRVTPAEVGQRLAATDKPMSIMDVAGASTQGIGSRVEVQPGPGRDMAHEFLHGRQSSMGERVTDDIGQAISGDDFHRSLEELDQVRRANAAPLYEKAYAKKFVWNDELEGLLARPHAKKALARAHTIAAEEGVDPKGLGLALDADGNVKIEKTAASMRTLDYVKRGLDDELETFRVPETGKLKLDERGRAVNNTRAKFVETVDRMNPDYAKARKEWAGPTQTMEAMHFGRRFIKGDPEVTIKRFNELSEGDKTAFRIGLARQLKETVGNVRDGANAVDRFFGSRAQRNRLKSFFPDNASFDAFEEAMKAEQKMSQTKNVVTGNSATARRVADREDDDGGIARAAFDYAEGGWKGAAMGFAKRSVGRAKGINEASANELAQMLMTSDPATQARVVDELIRRQTQIEAQSSKARGRVKRAVRGSSSLAGQGIGDLVSEDR